MFFRHVSGNSRTKSKHGIRTDHDLKGRGCRVCSLNRLESKIDSPKLAATGDESPVLYFVGEMLSKEDAENGIHFSDFIGMMFRSVLSDFIEPNDSRLLHFEGVRFNNVLKCEPSILKKKNISKEIECCSGYLEKDILESNPKLIIGLGAAPLKYLLKQNSVYNWRGRFVPILIEGTPFWFLSTYPLDSIFGEKTDKHVAAKQYAFRKDIEMACTQAAKLPDPRTVMYSEGYYDGIVTLEGKGRNEFRKLEKALDRYSLDEYVTIDIETDCLVPYNGGKILTCAVGNFDSCIAFPVDHPDGWDFDLRKQVKRLLCNFLKNSGRKIAHSATFEQEWLSYYYGFDFIARTKWEDTFSQAFVLDERSPNMLALECLTLLYFGFDVKALMGDKINRKRILANTLFDTLVYNALDVKWTHLLFYRQMEDLRKQGLEDLYFDGHVRLNMALTGTQVLGLHVDQDRVESLGTNIEKKLELLRKKLHKMPSVIEYEKKFGEFNSGSPSQVLTLFRDVLKRKEVLSNTSDGKEKYSTDAAVLSKIKRRESTVILEIRELAKLKSTYVDPLRTGSSIVYKDGKIHPRLNGCFARTGRLTSNDPNSQNYPHHKHSEIRSAIVGPEGTRLVAVDYSGIEARVIAMISNDLFYINAIKEGLDVHKDWGIKIVDRWPRFFDDTAKEYGITDEDDIWKKVRFRSKNEWVFAQFFGSTPYACARNMRIPPEVAEELAEEFWGMFSGVKKWHEDAIEFYNINGYIETLTGRRRRCPIDKEQIINSPVQGTAADIVKECMITLSEYALDVNDSKYRPVLNVHDDLSFYLPEKTIDEDIVKICQVMTIAPKLKWDWISVPLEVEVTAGPNWDEQTKYGVFVSTDFE